MGDVFSVAPAGYSVLKQRVDLDIDFAQQSLKGSTEITLQPLVKDLRQIWLHCRQCTPTSIQAGGITAKYEYEDPYQRLRMPRGATVHQQHMLKEKIEHSLRPQPSPWLSIALPPKLKIQELQLDPVNAQPQKDAPSNLQKEESDAAAIVAETPTISAAVQQHGPQFAPIKLLIEFEVSNFRDGVHWIGCETNDKRYPYMYTNAGPTPGTTSTIFPCVDDSTSRCSWELAIRCPRTLGDAFRRSKTMTSIVESGIKDDVEMADAAEAVPATVPESEYLIDLGGEDAALDLTIVSVGEQVDDVADSEDETRHTVTFSLNDPVTARHVGFAIGPFERVDLSSSRDADEEERLGQSAVKVDGFCLPGRGEELRNTCFPVTRIIDNFAVNYGSFPFSAYQIIFVDDLVHETVAIAGLSFCNSHLLFPEDIIEPLERNTRKIIRTVADQWMGVSVIAKEPVDAWAVAGIAGFMSDLFGRTLFGTNAYRWQQKLAAERVYDLDADRPSLYHQGALLHLDPSIRDFVDLKSALVLFILDRRLVKASGSTGVQRIINRVFLNAKTGALENGELTTAEFQRQCERLSHAKLEPFFNQWVRGAGCPIFDVTQRFNKKKLVVEMTITQRQMERKTKPEFAPNNFMREIKEHVAEVWALEPQPCFTGPMTIRIHEADGTPYEHIVEIKEQITKLDIPYNTKYKRLKRSRRQKDRIAAADSNTGEGGEDSLLYCLGDILDSKEDMDEWQLMDWSKDDEERMGQESYEWIRMDADFEWIGKIYLNLPLYMYVSQLQQDRDVVAQYEAMRCLSLANTHHVSLSILLRTLMDRRYFHGLRAMAAEGLAMLAAHCNPNQEGAERLRSLGQFHLEKAFEEMFCFPGEIMPKPNDWSDRTHFLLQCAIPRAMSRLRDTDGKVPASIRQFFMDKLRFNDNSDNPFSDCHYVATLMSCLADALVVSHREPQPVYTFAFGGDDEPMDTEDPDEPFKRQGIEAIERYRRIDEWETTYHNVYSLTALDCLQKLTKAGLVKDKVKEVLQYTQPANADLVRISAFRCLTETGFTRKASMMRYLLHSIADEPSPFVRNRLMACLGEALGHIALGDEEPLHAVAPPPTDGLVLEQAASGQARQFEALRKTPEGAIAALKIALGDDQVFKLALWYAINSLGTSLDEIAALCDLAGLLYPAIASSRVVMKLPRAYSSCEHRGKGKMVFKQNGPIRTSPNKPLDQEDSQMMRDLGLAYTGPVVPEEPVRRRQSSVEELSLKQVSELARQQQQQQQQQPPPQQPQQSMGPPTTTVEKAPVKIKIGGEKRKASVDPTVQRAGSPKVQKLSNNAGPSSRSPSVASQSRRSPSVPSQRRGSTPAAGAVGKAKKKTKVVKLKFSAAGSARMRDIVSPSPAAAVSNVQSPAPAWPQVNPAQLITPTTALPVQPISPGSYTHGSLLQSPSGGTNLFSPSSGPAISMNLGAFRSYGPTPEIAATTPADDKHEPAAINPAWPTLTTGTPSSLSPSAPTDTTSQSMQPPPVPAARPKVKIKLGVRKPSVDGGSAGSPQ
ncbi:Transcription initiation factor TFIID subunit 2 [Elasticomyces elasticus]|nr:Transcription initiation factor TFIID subunit 2 [Elasticomyces elasticus]KAK4921475.1 Transcription initiation factor TFIID subunit 2 [Elasticomyces elasticus]